MAHGYFFRRGDRILDHEVGMCECGGLHNEAELLLALIREIAGSGVAFEHPLLRYLEVQVDRDVWTELHRVIELVDP